MKITKSIVLSIMSICLFSFSMYGGDPVKKKGNNKINTQFLKYLSGLDISSVEDNETIKIDFILNAKGEILVTSTDNKELDASLKSKLNYKKLNFSNLELFERYTIPIKIKK